VKGLVAALVLAGALLACASDGNEGGVRSADEQYALATENFEQGDYPRAISAFQVFTYNYPQDPRVLDARWMTARAYYESEDWATAAQEFQNFQRDYPREARAGEALFLAGRAYQEMSLRPELDQRDTERAINVYDRVLREYAANELAEEARTRRDRLRNKLAEKAYLNGEFYFDNESYEAAETYLIDLIGSFPDTQWVAPAYALLARTYCEWGREERAIEMVGVLRERFAEATATREIVAGLESRCREPATGASSTGG
jgi:outer membrane protein assembly factor BamD